MKQLDFFRFYELGARLHGLLDGENGFRAGPLFAPLSEAQTLLDSFIKGEAVPLTSSRADAVRLLDRIGTIFNRHYIDSASRQLKPTEGEDRIEGHEIALLRTLIVKFEHALAAELNRAPTYAAGRRGIYSTYDLAENATDIFTDRVRAAVPPAARTEFALAGRALAFGLGTASAMHALRAVEIMLRRYYELFIEGVPAKTERGYSAQVKKLTVLAEDESATRRPDRRIVQMLAQVRDHYRNPLIMADSIVGMDEATQLFGLAGTIVTLMAEATLPQGEDESGDDAQYAFQIKEAG